MPVQVTMLGFKAVARWLSTGAKDRRWLLACVLAGLLWAGPAWAELSERQLKLLQNNCVQCHARPGLGAPLLGDADAWKERAARGEDAMLVNVVQGLRGMPPLGYCSACSEDDLRALIRQMSQLAPPGP